MATTCERHPDTETRLACSNCGTAVCPRCAVPTPVGQKCPRCAQQARTARARGKPRQYAKAVAAGLAATAVVAGGLALLIAAIGWLYILASGFGGYAIARAVDWGAEGNRASAFRLLSFGLALAAVQAAWLILGELVPNGLGMVTYLAAIYGAYLFHR